MGTITVFASGNKAEIKNVNNDDGKEMVDFIRSRLSGLKPAPSAAPVAAPAEPDVFDRLRRLGELRDTGVVAPEEFEAKKADLLSRL